MLFQPSGRGDQHVLDPELWHQIRILLVCVYVHFNFSNLDVYNNQLQEWSALALVSLGNLDMQYFRPRGAGGTNSQDQAVRELSFSHFDVHRVAGIHY